MEPANLRSQQCLFQEQLMSTSNSGYYSSMLSQSDFKLSTTTEDLDQDIVLESWPLKTTMSYNHQGFNSCGDFILSADHDEHEGDDQSHYPKEKQIMYHHYHHHNLSDHDQNQWMMVSNNFSSDCGHDITGLQPAGDNLYYNDNIAQNHASSHQKKLPPTSNCGYDFGHDILPSMNISNSDQSFSLASSNSSLDLNLQGHHHHVDLLSTPITYDRDVSSKSSQNGLCQFMRLLKESPSNSYSNKASGFEDVGYHRRKRPSSSSINNTEPKSIHAEAKKLRTTSKSSCPPLKVRKEKLGDRIAALQRLVAPYGKTDTASVLTEAIGYIQFLHDQVQTLSTVPFMRSSNCKATSTTIFMQENPMEKEVELKRDLRSRGLCLVPLSYACCLNSYNNYI